MRRTTASIALTIGLAILGLGGALAVPARAAGPNVKTVICPTATTTLTPVTGGDYHVGVGTPSNGCVVPTQPSVGAALSATVTPVGPFGCTGGAAKGAGLLQLTDGSFSLPVLVVVAGTTIIFEGNLGAVGAQSVIGEVQMVLPCGTGAMAFSIPTPPTSRLDGN